MFTFLVTQSLRNRVLILVAAGVLVVIGSLVAARLPVDVFPDLNRPTVTIMTEAEGLAPQEVEQLVTFPIETQMNGLPGVSRVRSVSGVGLSIVYVEFAWGTEIFRNRQQVAERLALLQSRLPANTTPQMGPVNSIMGQILLIALTAPDGVSPMTVRDVADFTVRPRLLTIPGVAQVIPMGGEVRQYRVAPNPAAMRAFGISFADLEKALAQFGANSGGGFTDQYAQEYLIRNIGRTLKLEDLANLVVGKSGNRPVHLRQLADVGFAARTKRGDAGYMGAPAVIVSVEKQPDVDTVRLTREIEQALAEAHAHAAGWHSRRQHSLPAGELHRDVGKECNTGAVRGGRRCRCRAVCIPAQLAHYGHIADGDTSIDSDHSDRLSRAGTVDQHHDARRSCHSDWRAVDDAVVDVENIFRRLRENRQRANPLPVFEVVVAASNEVRSGIVYATLIIVLVFVPLFALSGIEGRLFASLGVAYIISILASLAVSITLTPVLAFYLLPRLKRLDEHETWLVRSLKSTYSRILGRALSHQRTLLTGAVLAVLAAAAGATALPRTFLPPFNEGTLTINVLFSPGISLAESNRVGLIAEKLILEVPEVKAVGRRTGRAELDEHAEGVHSSEIEVDLKEVGRGKDAVLADLRARLGVLPVALNIGQPISHRLDHMLSGVRAQIAIKFFGDDLDTLRSIAEAFRQRLSRIPGLVDLQVEKQVRIPQLEIIVDHDRAALYGLQPQAVIEHLERLSNGRIVSRLVDGARRYDVVMRLDDARRTTQSLGDLLIETPYGWVPVRQIAEVREGDGPNQILRENGKRRSVVLANADGSVSMNQIVADIRRELAALSLPQSVYSTLEGTFQAQEEASRTIGALALLSLGMIFAILYSRYRSTALALIIMGSVPLALIGSVIALWLAGQPLSVASMIGFITLTGIASRNGILKISHYINLALHESMVFSEALVIRGSLERMTPVLMTAFAAGFALLPLMVDASAPGKEVLYPVAITIFGGLFSATLLDAVVTPVLFLRFGKKPLARLLAGARSADAAGTLASPQSY